MEKYNVDRIAALCSEMEKCRGWEALATELKNSLLDQIAATKFWQKRKREHLYQQIKMINQTVLIARNFAAFHESKQEEEE